MQSIVKASHTGDIEAEVCCVISNKPGAGGLNYAKENNIHTLTVDHRAFVSRELFDIELIKIINKFDPDLIVLAGFMRILTTTFINSFANKIINIHPSLLPKYPGLNTHQRVLDAGDKQHGSSVHYVTSDLDSGPVIIQSTVDILPYDTADKLSARVLAGEHTIYPIAISWVLSKSITTQKNRCFYNNSTIVKPANWYNGKLTFPTTEI